MKTKHFIIKKNPLFQKCPECGEANSLHRSRARNWKETLLKNTTIFKMYRCRKCGWRGKLSTITLTWESVKVLFYYLILSLVVAYIVRFVIKRFVA